MRAYVGREWERIGGIERAAAEMELYGSLDRTSPRREASPPEPADPIALARRVLGVPADADFGTIRKAYERIHKRSNPENFPEGSPEREQAAKIHEMVGKAYRILSAETDETEKRFRTLEID
jgi:hypothetical protein